MASANRIFVAYPYALPKDDYRRPFDDVAREFNVFFDFADEILTNKHVLDKIVTMIETARISLFDITEWNANVTLELGIAIGRGLDYYLLFNPTRSRKAVPSDLGGFDRIQYRSYAELGAGLRRLLAQEDFTPRAGSGALEGEYTTGDIRYGEARALTDLRTRVISLVSAAPGITRAALASELGVSRGALVGELNRLVDRRLIVKRDDDRGATRYFPPRRPSGAQG